MTVLDDMLPIALDLIYKSHVGTVNLVNPDVICHNRILELYREIVDPEHTWTNMNLDEQANILAAARSNNSLATDPKLGAPNIEVSIRRILEIYAAELRKKKAPLRKIYMITGGCGFIGSNFINYMIAKHGQDIQIINIDAMYYCAREENIDYRDAPNYKLVKANIRDIATILDIMREYRPTILIHFAAQSHVDSSFNKGDQSLDYTLDNVLGTHCLMEACREYGGFAKIIHVSTDEVYGGCLNTEHTEASILHPTNPYAASKAGAEMIVNSYRVSYNLPIIITRGNNVYGPNQYPEKLIPKWLTLLHKNKPLTIAGTGLQRRSFLWVDDVCKAFEIIADRGQIGEIYNIGSQTEYSVLDVADIIREIAGPAQLEYIPDRPFNDQRYFINSDKLIRLGWPGETIGLKEGLRLLNQLNNKN
jgi:dTDP-glucose 4,6-dehydratase